MPARVTKMMMIIILITFIFIFLQRYVVSHIWNVYGKRKSKEDNNLN